MGKIRNVYSMIYDNPERGNNGYGEFFRKI